MKHTAWVVGALLLFSLEGCASHKPAKAQPTIPRNCITDIHLTDTTKCTYDEKLKVWRCYPLTIDKLKGCEVMEIAPKEAPHAPAAAPQAEVPHAESGVPKP